MVKDTARAARPTIQRVNEIGFAYQQAGTLWAALDLELFTKIAAGARTLEAIAEALRMDVDAAARLLTACRALDLVERDDGVYRNAPDVERFLVKENPRYHGDWILTHRGGYDLWRNLAEALRPGDYRRAFDNPKRAREFTEVGYHSSVSAGQKLAREFDFSSCRSLLDLGGGSGVYSIMACQAHPDLRATVLDHPNVCRVADDFIALAGLQDRMQTTPGDYLKDDFPSGADIILFCGTLETHSTEECRTALRKALAALPAGGTLLLVINMLDPDERGPLEAVLSNLGQVANRSRRGRIHTESELTEMLVEAGFERLEAADFVPGTYRRLVARKPAAG